nr:MAG TPA: hypothetical protein [Caudoviricetes sp.]
MTCGPPHVLLHGEVFLSRLSQKVVAKVNMPCYYEFARYINAVDTGGNSGVWYFVNFLDYKNIISSTFLTVNRFC